MIKFKKTKLKKETETKQKPDFTLLVRSYQMTYISQDGKIIGAIGSCRSVRELHENLLTKYKK